ncbi:MAG: hypothetical protein HN778_17205 [Prolixibacteraceae bacterium]|jgi:hypothetical protein|nr:hypothetical protein [Prolixibacteraceae bacterium]MBT6004315.1 hypothetical protein [Prolixibacteraceae bacterium]MBT6765100.1 hypothetical protein [Prolixibacteraceae bacterium]MBT6999873.1 hypothetical protein [Prolixibacteraceae bacterium]MBT7396568.1 hypothetical protein [Prolixibacteraceae bacterium]
METPVKIIEIEGIKLTPEAIRKLRELQQGYDSSFFEKNGGVTENLEYLSDIKNFIIDELDYVSSDSKRIYDLFNILRLIDKFFESFKVPE